jgi:DNA-binding NarL/FixJ family response regulator
MIRVAVADDQALVRSGFAVLLRSAEGIDVVGEAADGREAVELARRVRPDVMLMDIRMPEMDGLEATRRITSDDATSATRVLILTTFDLDEYVFEALRAGASGFLLKDSPAEELLAGVRIVARGDALLDPSITRAVIEEFSRKPPRPGDLAQKLKALTARELEVLHGLARGLSNAEIAAELVVSDGTVKTHVARILQKLDLRDRVQAVIFAYESGLVEIGMTQHDT